MLYMISYDLRTPGRDYTPLRRAIIACADGGFCNPLESVFFIRSTLLAKEIADITLCLIDENDRFVVAQVSGGVSWYLDHSCSDHMLQLM